MGILSRLKALVKPPAKAAPLTEQQKIIKSWWDDGGDYRFRFDYNLNPDSIVLDLGGYEGQWASDLFSRYQCRILVFEPVKAFAKNIKQRFLLNGKISVFDFGLGATTRKESISISKDGSSIFREASEKEEIEIVDSYDWLTKESLGIVDLIKINIEGGEYELLEKLIDTGLISKIKNIQVQFHDIMADSSRRMESIQKKLEKTHFLTYQYRFVWENWKIKE
jgi:FkbM family methyltransferase